MNLTANDKVHKECLKLVKFSHQLLGDKFGSNPQEKSRDLEEKNFSNYSLNTRFEIAK